jgi:hypothetical protein
MSGTHSSKLSSDTFLCSIPDMHYLRRSAHWRSAAVLLGAAFMLGILPGASPPMDERPHTQPEQATCMPRPQRAITPGGASADTPAVSSGDFASVAATAEYLAYSNTTST